MGGVGAPNYVLYGDDDFSIILLMMKMVIDQEIPLPQDPEGDIAQARVRLPRHC